MLCLWIYLLWTCPRNAVALCGLWVWLSPGTMFRAHPCVAHGRSLLPSWPRPAAAALRHSHPHQWAGARGAGPRPSTFPSGPRPCPSPRAVFLPCDSLVHSWEMGKSGQVRAASQRVTVWDCRGRKNLLGMPGLEAPSVSLEARGLVWSICGHPSVFLPAFSAQVGEHEGQGGGGTGVGTRPCQACRSRWQPVWLLAPARP